MELQISQSFKVQWLNTTLKFIKDDTQLVKEYPQMPSSHVEYLHNLIWQRKNDEGLGFKSLYSPVWEAMKIYSMKYKFKILVEKSEDGISGYLKMEKIPKTGQLAKKLSDEKKDKKNSDGKKETGNETIQNYEVIKKSQTETVKCKQPELEPLNKAKTKKSVPKMSKNRKMFIENQKMLDSLSPLFIKTTLKSILDFVTDELSASKIFSNLAPIESRFLENFLSIYQRKNDLEVLLSPASNEILMEISKCFEDFSKTYSLDISSVEINSKTNKREVKYTKVPVFSSKENAKQKLKENSIQVKTKTISNNISKIVNVHSISKEQYNITLEKNVSKETKKCKSILQNNAISEDRYANSEPIDKDIETIDNNVIEALSTSVKKTDDVKPKTTTYLKDTSFNKSLLLPKKSISFTKEGTSSTADTSYIKEDQKSTRMKILQDMTVPINSDKVVSVPLPKKSISFTNEGTSSAADTKHIRVDQESPKITILQDMTVPIKSEKALSQNYEVIKKPQTESAKCKQPETEPRNKAKPKKPLPQMSKGLKMFMENQEILDSLSPLFIKTTLKSILGFIADELSASKIFSNLAPIESRFLENFLSIYQRKNDLEVLLSPASNEILMEISKCFEDFSKTYSLDISSVEINSKTNKREVHYTKVPVFPKNKKAKKKLKENSIQIKLQTISPNKTTKIVNVHSISKEQYNITVQKNVSLETKKSKSIDKTIILQNNAISEDRYANSEPIDKDIETIDNNVIEALSTFVKKADVKPKTTTYLKDTSLKKSVPLLKKSISFTKEGTSSTADTPHIKVDQKSPRMKILQDMTVPINSDKAVKMMQLMGWKGGALGLRGDGITEPIIPTPNYKACGLGHVSVKKDSNNATKEHIRSEFVNKILEMIDNNIEMSVIKVQNQLNKREIKFLEVTLKIINNRMNLDPELEKRLEIEDRMKRNMDIIFNLVFENNNRKIIITKTSKTEIKVVNQDLKRKTKSEESEASFKTIVLKSILKLLKSEYNENVIHFEKELKAKHFNCSSTIIVQINQRQLVQQKNNPVVAELGSKVLKAIGDILLSVTIHESERYIVIKKILPKNKVNQEIIQTNVNTAENDENNSAFDNVRGHLKNKKKCKLLNALYKYEMDYTEEFRDNQWYNTEDKCLLDSEEINKGINNTQKEIHKNIKNNIKHDQNNNEGIACFKV